MISLDGEVCETDACRGGLWAARRAEARRYTDHRHFLVQFQLLAGRNIDALVFVEDVKHFIRCVANRSWRLDHPHRNRFALQHLAGSELVDRSDDGHSWIML
ncbi:MAG: hypothetical protein DMF58_00675 [Acidobacteria bacterium]|nr:MAG: hypothetical protein DMF58_00675 [Acidobacteriota bacterium]